MQGFWWAPDGKSLAYEEADNRGVEQLTIPDVAHPEHAPEPTYYPRPGKANAKVRLGLIGVGRRRDDVGGVGSRQAAVPGARGAGATRRR